MMDGSSRDPLTEYKLQLSSVEDALKSANADNRTDLLDLKAKLTEVISLLQGKPVESEASIGDSETNSIDDEFLKFQQEIKELGSDEPSQENDDTGREEDAIREELYSALSAMEGNKCRAPFAREWGEKSFHNAIIFSTDVEDQNVDNLQDAMVKVMFCNPTCDAMKPCPYFLDGHCKFSDGKCRYSHGYAVKFSELEEYIFPDYSNVQRDSRVLAQYKDGLWHSAIVENCLEHQKYFVKFLNSGKTETVAAHAILPLDGAISSSDDDDSSSDSSVEETAFAEEILDPANTSNEINYQVVPSASAIGSWEQHTKGIGSKLMAKMGYVWGQGLGKDSNGRIDPVEAIVLPKGKSLDKCAEMREMANLQSVEERFSSEQKKEEQRSKVAELHTNSDGSVFDFLNKNLSGKSDQFSDKNGEVLRKRTSTEASNSSDASSKTQAKDLNFEMYSVGESIKKTKKEISRLLQSVNRNSERNEAACALMRQKVTAQSNLLKSLEAKERRISDEINKKKNHKKIAIF